MNTQEFEDRLTATLNKKAIKQWDYFIEQQYPQVKVVKQKNNAKYADREYKKVMTIEVPTLDGSILVSVCGTKDTIDFYYFSITKDNDSEENLWDMYEKYKIMKAFGAKV
jgi:hypothetical protein